ncbi:Hypothetical protein FKW44_020325 [Caligus rogercresseyi]|uniref:Uncharacterized protein n=1 Tax=Caligus rogercresseyi TaxID=217165 RepID=A0A7T8GX20_CALRO|nr:Hypothetical protein FKW44_020325 [Caligus rogercresseyi]
MVEGEEVVGAFEGEDPRDREETEESATAVEEEEEALMKTAVHPSPLAFEEEEASTATTATLEAVGTFAVADGRMKSPQQEEEAEELLLQVTTTAKDLRIGVKK